MKFAPVAAMLLTLSCGAAPRQIDSSGQSHGSGGWNETEADALEAVRASAERDIRCPRNQIRPWKVPNRSSLWYWYFADGCGQRATYVQDCSTDSCRCVLVATVQIR